MINIKLLREQPEALKNACRAKGVKVDIDVLIKLDQSRRDLIAESESLKFQQNQLSKEVPQLKGADKENKIKQATNLAQSIKTKEKDLKEIEAEFNQLIVQIPNLPLESVKIGNDESDNEVIKKWGKIPSFKFPIKDHLTLGNELNLIDTERAANVSGSRFNYLKNQAVLLANALNSLVIAKLVKKGFIPILPPLMIKQEMMQAMGYLDRAEEEVYRTVKDSLFLIGTSEQSLGPLHNKEIFEDKDLPKRYIAFSPAFRREAGSYGKDVKGIIRLHQFHKLEMFSFVKPEDSIKEHQFLLEIQEELVQSLKIPYQLINICSGDLGTPAAAKFDIECWMPAQEQYRETHSTSNCTDFQARRLRIKYRDKDGKTELVHTLNGTAFAIERILVAILENFQQKDGSIKIPKVLQKYCGFKKIEAKRKNK